MHDGVGAFKSAASCHPEGARVVFSKLDEGGLPKEIAAEEHAVADFLLIQMGGKFADSERCGRFHPDHETEPGTIRSALGGVPRERGRFSPRSF